MVRDTRGEAVARVEDWLERQIPKRTEGPALTEEQLFAAYGVWGRQGIPATSFPVTRRRKGEG